MDETRTCASRYTVVSGDSYYSIAQKFQVDVGDLVALNPDHPPARLMVGDVLCIPARRDEGGSGGTSGGTAGDTGNSGTSGGTSGGTGSGGTTGDTGNSGTSGGTTGGTGSGGTSGGTAGDTGSGSTSGGTTGDTGNSGTSGGTAGDTGSGGTSGGATGGTGNDGSSNGTTGGTGSGGTSGGASQAPDACPRPEDACPANRRTVVQNDQTAADLQLKYNLSYYTLQRANATTNLDTIRGGDTLCIPEQNQPCPVPPTYTLQTGDTLESVALVYRLPVGQLLRANPCLAPDDFAPGVTVRLPGQ